QVDDEGTVAQGPLRPAVAPGTDRHPPAALTRQTDPGDHVRLGGRPQDGGGGAVGKAAVEDPGDPGQRVALVSPPPPLADEGGGLDGHQAGATRACSVWPMIRPGSAPGVSGWISHSASRRLLSSTIFTRGKRRSMNDSSARGTSRPLVSSSARTTASSA